MERGSKKETALFARHPEGGERERRDGKKTKGAGLYDIMHCLSPKIKLRLFIWLTHVLISAEAMHFCMLKLKSVLAVPCLALLHNIFTDFS